MGSSSEITARPAEGNDETIDAVGTSLSAAQQQRPLGRGTMLERYVVLEQLGAGGMGVVYAAYDPELDRKVAIKLVHAERGGHRGSEGATQLLLEAQAMAKLAHPNVIVVHDVGTHREQVFIAMEHLDGGTLRQFIEEHEPSWPDVLARFRQAGAGLAAAHAASMVHRDFKPENVLLAQDGRLRVMDFGLAIPLSSARGAQTLEHSGPSDPAPLDSLRARMTKTGALAGTPAYMAPEQHDGDEVDELSDQFAFCVSLYEALYRQRPFEGNSVLSLAIAKQREQIREVPADTAVPRWIEAIVRRGLSAEPTDRHPSMGALLEALAHDPAIARRRHLRTAAFGLGVVGVGVAAFSVARDEEPRCTGGEDRIAQVWNDRSRADAKAAFEAVDQPYAATAWTRAHERMQRYAGDWTQMYRDACEATHVRGEQSEQLLDYRMVCLQRRQRQLQSLLELFATADAELVERAHRVVDGLEPVQTCADVEAMLDRIDPPDPANADRVQRAWEVLDAVALLRDAARFEQGQERVDALIPEVEALAYAPLRAKHLYMRAALAMDRGQWDDAEALMYEAAISASAAHDDALATTAWSALVIQVGAVKRRYDAVLPIEKAAQAALARLDEGGLHEARLLAALGTVDLLRTEYARAETRLVRAVQLYEKLGVQSRPDGWDAREMLAAVHHGQQRYELAATELETLADEITAGVGGNHPALAQVLANWARTFTARDRPAEAVELYLRALDLFVAGWGPRSQQVGNVHMNLSRAYRELDDLNGAYEHFELGRDIDLELYGEQSEPYGLDLHDEGQLSMLRDDPAGALESYRRSYEILEALHGDHDPQLAYPLTSMGRALIALDRSNEALAPLERALAIREGNRDVPPTERAFTQRLLAQALHASDRDRSRAVGLARSALTAYREAGADEPVQELQAFLREAG